LNNNRKEKYRNDFSGLVETLKKSRMQKMNALGSISKHSRITFDCKDPIIENEQEDDNRNIASLNFNRFA